MAKRNHKKASAPAKKETRGQLPPRLMWRQEKDGNWVPVTVIGSIVIPGEPRPFMGFWKGERDAILVWVKQMLSEILFDCPKFLVNEKTMATAKNPDWDLLPYFEKSPDEPDTFVEVTPEPSMSQLVAGDKLPSGS